MPIQVTFELSDRDLAHFRTLILEASKTAKNASADAVIESAQNLVAEVRKGDVPDFIADRVGKLRSLIDMLDDEDWALPARDRRRVMNALAYFTEAEDLIPDHTPILGFLDDAIMVELLTHSLRPEIEAYKEFCRFREDAVKREAIRSETAAVRQKDLEERRKRIIKNMHERINAEREAPRSQPSVRTTFFGES